MNEIRAWSAAICFVALGCSAVRLLAPKAGSGKLFSLVTSSFFLCAMIVPLMKTASLPDLTVTLPSFDNSSTQLEERVTAQLSAQIQAAAVSMVTEAMAERNITPKKVDVQTDISESGGIYMKQIVVCVDKQSVPVASVVREVLERQLETTIIIETEG